MEQGWQKAVNDKIETSAQDSVGVLRNLWEIRVRKSSRKIYVDPQDLSSSTSRLLIWQALKSYSTKSLIAMLTDPELIVRTAVSRELQLRGGKVVWRLCKDLCHSKKVEDRVSGLFILGQLGTPELPYRKHSLSLIQALLRREHSLPVVEQAFYAIGHLRKGEPLEDESLEELVRKRKTFKRSALAEAKAFALGRHQ
jgi:hypothetical protein